MEFTARPDSLVIDDKGEVKITLIVNERQYVKENYENDINGEIVGTTVIPFIFFLDI